MPQSHSSEFERIREYFSHRPAVYDQKDVVEFRDMRWLEVRLGGKGFLLPLVNVGTAEDPTAIAWFDPHPDRNPELSAAAAKSMAEMLSKIHPRLIVTPPSTKSGPFIEEAARRVNSSKPLHVITLLGGDDEAEVATRSVIPPVRYIPVTRLASGIPKFLGIDWSMRREVLRTQPEKLVIAEDVESTGKTIAAIVKLLTLTNYQVVAIAKESELRDGYPPKLDPNRHIAFHLPEIKGLYGKLHAVEPKGQIPKAIPVR